MTAAHLDRHLHHLSSSFRRYAVCQFVMLVMLYISFFLFSSSFVCEASPSNNEHGNVDELTLPQVLKTSSIIEDAPDKVQEKIRRYLESTVHDGISVVENPNLECFSESCKEVAQEIQAQMDNSVDPCDDADQYMCGGWYKTFKLPDDEYRWKISSTGIANRTRHTIKDILESQSCSEMKSLPNQTAWDVMSTCLYESCMDTAKMDAKGAIPLFDLMFNTSTSLDFLITFPLEEEEKTMTYQKKRHILSHRLHVISKQLKNLFFFAIHVGQNVIDPSKNQTFIVSSMSLGMSYYFYEKKYKSIQKDYKEHMENLLELFDASLEEYNADYKALYIKNNPNRANHTFKERIEKLYNFDLSLREIMLTPEESRNVLRNTRSITYGELKKSSPLIDVEKILSFFLQYIPEDVTVDDDSVFIIQQKNYMTKLSEKLDKASWSTLHDYLLVNILNNYAPRLSAKWRKTKDDYRKKRSQAETLPRWRRCILSLPSWIIGHRFIKKQFDVRRKIITEDLIDNLRSVFEKMLLETDWMDENAKLLSVEKLKGMTEQIAFPEWLMNDYDVRFEKYYGPKSGVNKMDDYFNAIMYLADYSFRDALSKFGKSVDKNEWTLTPQSVNAFYSVWRNEIGFSAAILEKPSVQVWSEVDGNRAEKIVMLAMTYGGIGCVIGHEITHGFDDVGKDFDKEGRLHKWWSNSSEVNFRKKAMCMENQYNRYSLNLTIPNAEGINETNENFVRGALTLGENIADNGGMRLSWEALKLELSEKEMYSRPLLPYGVNLTVLELFMYSWGRFWCAVARPKILLQRIESGYHSPDVFRINGALANFEPYADIYKCPKNSQLHPETRCRVW